MARATKKPKSMDNETRAKLVKLAESVVKQVQKKENPIIQIPTRSLSNVHFDPKKKMFRAMI